jgi:hypothetical protein
MQPNKRCHHRSCFFGAFTLGFEIVLEKAQRSPLSINWPTCLVGQPLQRLNEESLIQQLI